MDQHIPASAIALVAKAPPPVGRRPGAGESSMGAGQ